MIQVLKMIHGIDKVNLWKLFCIDKDERTRKHRLCLKIKRHILIYLKIFTKRVINYWNHPTDVVVSFKSLSTFKIKLEEFMTQKGKFKFIVVLLIYDLFLKLVLFLYSLLGN